MDKLFDKLPYDDLEGIQFTHMLGGAIGIGLILFLGYFFTLHSFTNEEFEKLVKQREEAERTLKRYNSKIAERGLVAKNMSRVKGQFEAYINQMPDQDEIPGLLEQIAEFGKKRNIRMVELTLQEGEISDYYKEIPLKVEVSGELWVTLDFIEYIQNLLRLVSFENLILQGRDVDNRIRVSGTNSNFLNTTLTAKTYSFISGAENRGPKKKEPAKANKPARKRSGH